MGTGHNPPPPHRREWVGPVGHNALSENTVLETGQSTLEAGGYQLYKGRETKE